MDELSQLDELIESDILEALGQDIPENIKKEESINIEDLENEISMAQKLLSDPDFYQNPDAQNLTINLKSMEQELEQLYDKWSELDSGQ